MHRAFGEFRYIRWTDFGDADGERHPIFAYKEYTQIYTTTINLSTILTNILSPLRGTEKGNKRSKKH